MSEDCGCHISHYGSDFEGIQHCPLHTAAPDLLAELKHLVRLLDRPVDSGINVPGLATLNGARAAIAKAEPPTQEAPCDQT